MNSALKNDHLVDQQEQQFHGPYVGIVEATTDPMMIGRCRVRVQLVYGDQNQTPTTVLPWCAPCFPAFWFNPPQVGDQVWVLFQGGDARYPVYLGWMPTIPSAAQVRQRHPQFPPLTYGGDTVDGDPLDWQQPQTLPIQDVPAAGAEPNSPPNVETYSTNANISETPPEVLRGRDLDPNTRIFKTFRGHTIVFNDHPMSEYIKIIDRSGQMLFFDCALQDPNNNNNSTPRGGTIQASTEQGIGEADKQVENGRTQLPINVMRQRPSENNRASIRLTDLFGQYLEYWAEKNKAHIKIQSARFKDDDQTPNHWFEIVSDIQTPDEHILFQSREGHFIRIDETNNFIRVQHKDGSYILIDANSDITIHRASQYTQIFDSSNIILATEVIYKKLAWIENMMAKFNNHTHYYRPGGGPVIETTNPILQMDFGDGTTVTEAG